MSWPVPERRARLLELYRSGLTFAEIAREYGGTPEGVRSTIRKMRERGDAPERQRLCGVNNRWGVMA
jgi:DNA-binding CsgD family transcriptional regulator